MGKITKVSLCHRKWSEEGKTYIEPAIRVERDDDSKTEYLFRYADTNEPLNLESGLFVMIDKQYVWSGVRKDTIVERYVVNVQSAGQEPMVIQSFRLFTYEDRAKSAKPSRWMWNYGPLEGKFADERPAPPPNDGRRRWKNGPKANCVILGNPPPPQERSAGGGRSGGRNGGGRSGGGRGGSGRSGGGGRSHSGNRGGGHRSGGGARRYDDRRGGNRRDADSRGGGGNRRDSDSRVGDKRDGDRRSGPRRPGSSRNTG